MNRFGMFGKMTAQPGQRDTLVQYLLTAAELVSNAPGCELYVVGTSPTEPDTIWVTEVWRSKEDHDASLSMAGVGELIAKARPLIAAIGEPILTVPVGGKGLTKLRLPLVSYTAYLPLQQRRGAMAEGNRAASGASRQQVEASGRPTGIYRLLLICGIVGSALFNATYLIAGAIRPAYDPWKQPMSVLSLGDGGWVQMINFIIFGLLIICFAAGLRIALAPGTADTWGPLLQVIVALGLILAGIFSQDPAPGYPPGAIIPNPPTTHAVIHLAATFLAFGARVIWCFVIARRFAIEPRWRGWATYSIVTGILMVALLATFGMEMANNGPAGLFEKLASMVTSVLTFLLAARLLSGVGFTNHSKG